jgi:hypothetical protein
MIAPFAAVTTLTLRLFTPLLIGAALALSIFMLGRLVASRKLNRALDDDDDAPEDHVDGVPSAIEFERTREFVRTRTAKPASGAVARSTGAG